MKKQYNLILRIKENKQILINLVYDNYIWAKSKFFEVYEKFDKSVYDLYILNSDGKVIDEA